MHGIFRFLHYLTYCMEQVQISSIRIGLFRKATRIFHNIDTSRTLHGRRHEWVPHKRFPTLNNTFNWNKNTQLFTAEAAVVAAAINFLRPFFRRKHRKWARWTSHWTKRSPWFSRFLLHEGKNAGFYTSYCLLWERKNYAEEGVILK